MLVAELAFFAHLVGTSQPEPQPEPEPVVVEDTPAEPQVPVYYQRDERWGGLPYADGDLSTSGCGLTCAAMAWSYLSGEEWTPVRVLNAVGNDYVQAGQNYMPGFCEWMRSQDPTLDYTVMYEDRQRALDEAAQGRMVFGSMTGQLTEDGESYGGHIVLICGVQGDEITVHDPCSVIPVTIDSARFQEVDWGYFISIGRSA